MKKVRDAGGLFLFLSLIIFFSLLAGFFGLFKLQRYGVVADCLFIIAF